MQRTSACSLAVLLWALFSLSAIARPHARALLNQPLSSSSAPSPSSSSLRRPSPIRPRSSPPPALHWGCASLDRSVALTFDDGPSEHTERLLDILKQLEVRATFFVIVNAALARPAIVRRALAEGHTVGLHTLSHANLTSLDEAGLTREVDYAAAALRSITGQPPLFFRPPFGAVTPSIRDRVFNLGMDVALWSGGCIDWLLLNATAETRVEIAGLADAGGLLCLHDTHGETVDGVAGLVAALRSSDGWVNPQGRNIVSIGHCAGTDGAP